MEFEFIVFNIVILLFSVVVHEVAHGYVAEHLGDPTARNAGRRVIGIEIDPVYAAVAARTLAQAPLFPPRSASEQLVLTP
jgi:Zn-dependent protease